MANHIQSDGSLYVDTLKPTYNSVDLTEVELPEVESKFNHNGHAREDADINSMLDVSAERMHYNRVGSELHLIMPTTHVFYHSKRITQMRHEMVLQKEGEMELTVLTHMDDMRRVALRTQRCVYSLCLMVRRNICLNALDL